MSDTNKEANPVQGASLGGHDLDLYKFLIDGLPIAVVTIDSEYRITSFNQWAQKITGYSAQEVVGKFCRDILQGGMCKGGCPLKKVIMGKSTICRTETTIQNRWGKIIPVKMNTAGLFDDGNLIGGIDAFQDISYVKSMEQEKEAFISMIAHDMKSPLISIQGFARRLTDNPNIDKEKKEEYLSIITNEAGRLEGLLNDFLEFSRMNTGRLKLELSPVNLDKKLVDLYEIYSTKAAQKGIELKFDYRKPMPVIHADDRQLRRVFTNLLDNAIKFSNDNGVISITAYVDQQEVIIKIADQGIGIDPEDFPYIFEPFRRGKHDKETSGFGIGLASAKIIVEAHNGSINIETEPGKGSVFTVSLPKGTKKEG